MLGLWQFWNSNTFCGKQDLLETIQNVIGGTLGIATNTIGQCPAKSGFNLLFICLNSYVQLTLHNMPGVYRFRTNMQGWVRFALWRPCTGRTFVGIVCDP
jgi:hypothetical protein